ncbi:xyloglucan-specific endo-beta-1-4-glucanase A [Penicillium diatomitis]|uniref:xyloglucan-specific endo-beta-1,4-glucanase n=1 Tax=Penicillium diatomitis TaxID=2819901 RepID=A0A9W9WVH8_9EURO|nr:xyloglucan-specific endo-beta-1-4-glucanase A [Penicillium diatomitis]KAJ5477478.1 xyloglucan-specific endo-beta-1-4-glucanase A [Penicillium diatomitis]
MKTFTPLSLLTVALAGLGDAAAVSTNTLTRRSDFCDQWGSVTKGNYIVYNNLWGQSADPSGHQCTGVDSLNGNTIAWHTSFGWTGAKYSVKSFANIALKFTAKTLKDVKSINSTWKWSYSNTNIVADVSYDMFLKSNPSASSSEYEIMVWLAALDGAGPISSTGAPIATTTINGVTWKLYKGPNGSMTVYSFVAESTVTDFSGDLKKFFTYLIDQQGLNSNLYLVDVQAGTEPFTGSAKLTTTAYSAVVA